MDDADTGIETNASRAAGDRLLIAPPEETAYWPVSALAEILFCPRNFYYRFVEGAEDENQHTLQGRWADERRALRDEVQREAGLQIRSVTAASDELGLVAVLDVVEDNGELYPVEFKKGRLAERPHDDLQVCAQAMVLEEATGRPVPFGYVYYAASRRRRRVECGPELRDLVVDTLRQAREIVMSGEIPPPVNDARCRGCALQNRCLPWEVERAGKPVGTKAGARPTPALNWGRVLYVDEEGAYVRKSGERVVVTQEGNTLREVPLAGLDEVVLVGRAGFSQAFAAAAMRRGLPVHFVSPSGRYDGALAPARGRNVLLRLAQARAHFDEATRLRFSRAFAEGKLANMRTLLLRYGRERSDEVLQRKARALAALVARVRSCTSRDELMGIEGAATRHYFEGFPRFLREGLPFDFHKRTRARPAIP